MVQVRWTALDNSISTLVYQIDVQDEINLQLGEFLKNIKRAGQNTEVVPALCAFWDLLHELCVGGIVVGPLLMRKPQFACT